MRRITEEILVIKKSTMMKTVKEVENHNASPSRSLGQVELAKAKPKVTIPDPQLMMKNDLELIKAQLQAQTKAFQALSHSLTLLQQQSSHQQGRLKALEEEVQFATHFAHGEMFNGLLQKRIQEVWRVMVREVAGLQSSMIQKQSSMESLSQDVLESKKFLWEELESVQGELRRIHQKLKDQEVDITRNLVSIKKMQENQMKCTEYLTQLRAKTPDDALEAVDNKPGAEELNELWSAVDILHNSATSNYDKRSSSRMKNRGSQHQRQSHSPSPASNFSDSTLYHHRRSSSEHRS